MGVIIFIVIAALVGVGVLTGILNEKKRGNMDKDGKLHCNRCGCTSFIHDQDKYGRAVTKCVNCGQSWKTF